MEKKVKKRVGEQEGTQGKMKDGVERRRNRGKEGRRKEWKMGVKKYTEGKQR